MQLELFSSPGEGDSRYLVEASRPFLAAAAGRSQRLPAVAYLAAATVGDDWLRYAENAYHAIADVVLVDVERRSPSDIAEVLGRSAMLLVSGGNTFVLSHRLHHHRVFPIFRDHIRSGLPVVAFSAGANLCGPNVLTTNDMNVCATSHFDGFGLVPYNLNVHYPSDDASRTDRDERLAHYHAFHSNPVLALEDGAWLGVHDGGVTVRRGHCWLVDRGTPRRLLDVGCTLPLQGR